MNKRITLAAASALLLGLAVAGCSRSDEPTPPTTKEDGAKTPVARTPARPPAPAPSVSPSPTPSKTAQVPKEAPRAADDQMMDDASATGMTSRASRDEPPADGDASEETEAK